MALKNVWAQTSPTFFTNLQLEKKKSDFIISSMAQETSEKEAIMYFYESSLLQKHRAFSFTVKVMMYYLLGAIFHFIVALNSLASGSHCELLWLHISHYNTVDLAKGSLNSS